MSRLIICGGGLAGSLAAIAIATKWPDIELLLVEESGSFGGNHTWSYFDSDVPLGAGWLVDRIGARRWPDHEVRFPSRSRILQIGYNSIRSNDLDIAVRTALAAAQYRLKAKVTQVAPDHIKIGDERVDAECVIDARGPRGAPGLDLGWQKFLGRIYHLPRPHGVARPIIMDATVEQIDGFRFVYLLPFSATEVLIEDTYYSSSPVIDVDQLGSRLDTLAESLGAGGVMVSEEQGTLPVVIGGEVERLWPKSESVPRLGLAGGFFHPTTSYSLPDALANAVWIADQKDLSSSALHVGLRNRAGRLWRKRRFFQILNRMLFRAAEPDQRYRVLEHFYRLPAPLISRFYAAQLTPLDKLRILSGRPPVPLGKALSAWLKKAA